MIFDYIIDESSEALISSSFASHLTADMTTMMRWKAAKFVIKQSKSNMKNFDIYVVRVEKKKLWFRASTDDSPNFSLSTYCAGLTCLVSAMPSSSAYAIRSRFSSMMKWSRRSFTSQIDIPCHVGCLSIIHFNIEALIFYERTRVGVEKIFNSGSSVSEKFIWTRAECETRRQIKSKEHENMMKIT